MQCYGATSSEVHGFPVQHHLRETPMYTCITSINCHLYCKYICMSTIHDTKNCYLRCTIISGSTTLPLSEIERYPIEYSKLCTAMYEYAIQAKKKLHPFWQFTLLPWCWYCCVVRLMLFCVSTQSRPFGHLGSFPLCRGR